MKFLCDQCKTKYQIADEKAVGKTLRMKCRKCGHLIEVRAAAAVASQSTPPPANVPRAPQAPPRPPAKPAVAPLASSLAAKPPPKSDRPPAGALAGAFKSTVRDEEVSAPFDMSDLGGTNDEWYVAVNGVPVGPIRVAEIRRKAANGAVTEDSLAWQEGLDEWRAVRSFPDLAAVVREAIASGRPSLTPVPPSVGHGPARTTAARASLGPQPPRGGVGRHVSTADTTAVRSNVVPISSRLATAQNLSPQHDDLTIPVTSEAPIEPMAAAVQADPFAAPAPPRPAPVVAEASIPPQERKKPFPWIQVAMLACAIAFGATGAVVAFSRPAPTQQIIYQQMPTAEPSAGPAVTASAETAQAPEAPSATKVATNGRPSSGGSAPAAAAAAPKSGGLDLSSLRGGRISPVGENGGDNAPAPGQCLSAGMVTNVMTAHQVAIRRQCWDRNPGNKPAANVTLSMTVGPDGSPGGISASGDDAAVASCIQNDARQWHFPAMGCSQPVNIPFHFVRQ